MQKKTGSPLPSSSAYYGCMIGESLLLVANWAVTNLGRNKICGKMYEEFTPINKSMEKTSVLRVLFIKAQVPTLGLEYSFQEHI